MSDEIRRLITEKLAGITTVETAPSEDLERLHRQRVKRAVERGIPWRYLRFIAQGTEPKSTKALTAAKQFLQPPFQWALVLAGPPGCGKTYSAAWACWERCGRFLDVAKLARLSSYDDETMALYERAALLVIDDLGTEYADAKGAFQSRLDGLLSYRCASERQTVITTNLNGAEFRERYGDRIADRLNEGGRYLEISEPSLRGAR